MAVFYLTKRAKRDLDAIEKYLIEKWGKKRAKQYMADLYRAFGRIASDPRIGHLRRHRSEPFLMAPAEQHFAIYNTVTKGIIIATVLHSRQNIDSIIHQIGPALTAEIAKIEYSIE